MKYFYGLVLILILLTTSLASAESKFWQSYTYTVTRVKDGDTIEVTDGNLKFAVRLATIDAPEKTQAFGKVAKYRLQELVEGKKITIQTIGRGLEKYGRILGIVYADGIDVSLTLVDEGLATYYRPSCKDFEPGSKGYEFDPRPYVDAEKIARQKRLKFWSAEGEVLPCGFRKKSENKGGFPSWGSQ